MNRRKALLALFALGCSGIASARPYMPHFNRPGRDDQEQPGPSALLSQGLNKLVGFMEQKNPPSRKQQMRFIEQEIAPYFDFEYMARWTGGPGWRYMKAEQRFLHESRLKEMFLSGLVQRLSQFGGQGFRVMRSRRGRDGEISVNVAIMNARGYPSRLDFRFYRSPVGWKVYDVSANGNSVLVYFRQRMNQRNPQGRRFGGYPAMR